MNKPLTTRERLAAGASLLWLVLGPIVAAACLTLAVEVDGHEITTIEGVGDAKRLHPLQSAFLKNHAVQCGFCTPGMIMTTLGLIAENPAPTEQEIKVALAGNLCRCTGYRQIIDAIQEGAEAMRQEGSVK